MRLEVPVDVEGFRKFLTVELLTGANYIGLDVDQERWAILQESSCRALSVFFAIAADELSRAGK